MTKDVTLLTGFLGSGKTTLVNALMAARPATRFALIENEFGEESIDGALVLRPDVDIVEMSNGCLCCSLNDGLLDVLEALKDRQDSFDELLIETTGIADPAGVAMPFLMLPMRSGVPVQRAFTLKRIICLVDAVRIENQLRDTEEAITQISFSDVILINKTDSVSPEYIIELRETLRGLNPLVEVLIGNSAGYPIDALLAVKRDSAASVRPTTYLPKRQDPNEKHHPEDNVGQAESVQLHRHHHHVHSKIVSLSFRFAEPFYLTELYHRLMSLVLFRGRDIYRIKGIIAVTDRSERMILQSVGQSMTITEGADWLPGEDRISRLVFIGKGLKLAEFEALLRQCLTGQSTWEMTTAARLMETPNP